VIEVELSAIFASRSELTEAVMVWLPAAVARTENTTLVEPPFGT
jgi:hypothetical protein